MSENNEVSRSYPGMPGGEEARRAMDDVIDAANSACPTCGGSGGSDDPALRCRACNGSGSIGPEPDDTPCQHQWKSQQLGGPPDMAESYEWVTYCKLCGAEKVDED